MFAEYKPASTSDFEMKYMGMMHYFLGIVTPCFPQSVNITILARELWKTQRCDV
jgi:hypothetical protein